MAERFVQSNERIHSPEQFIIHKHVFLPYGPSGTGKSSSIKLLGNYLQIPESRIYYTGKKFRQYHKDAGGKDFIDFIDRPEIVDKEIDFMHQYYIMKAALSNKPIFIEGRLSPFHNLVAQEFAQKNSLPSPQTYTILFSMRDEEKRFDGLYKREHELNPSVTRENVKTLTLQREAADLARWNSLYPNFIQGQNHFDPNFTYNEKLLYDKVVYFDDFTSAQEIADYLLKELLQENIIEKKSPKNNDFIIFP